MGAILRTVSLEIDHVTKRFAATTALDELTFDVARGEVFGFLGANGAGKTTTMRICLGIIRADAGEIRWDGTSTATVPRRTWGYLPEERGLYPRMGVLDQLVYFGSLYGLEPDRARRDALGWLARFRIPELATRRAEELSKGNQQKVQLIGTLLHDPDLIILDEPQSGLDPVNMVVVRNLLRELKEEGRTILLSTHMMGEAEKMADEIVLIHRGKVVLQGGLENVRESFGRNTLFLDYEGDGSFLAHLPQVKEANVVTNAAELTLTDGADPQAILQAAMGRVRIRRFELGTPSLEKIFIDQVGADTLAEEVTR
jgi:ABC-2 type transport system ATP-binding protein